MGGAVFSGELKTVRTSNKFFTLEGGMAIARFLRISGGVGRQ